MKKIFYIFIFFILLYSLKVEAKGINQISIVAPKEVKVGTEFQIDVRIGLEEV